MHRESNCHALRARPIFYLEGGSEDQLLGSTAKSHRCAMAAKPKSNDLSSMKRLRLLSLVGITSIALAHAGWAAGHGGGGGGFGGGGFSGGHAGGGGGGGFHGGGFHGGGFSGGGFHGGGFRGGGGGHFSSMRGGHMFARGGTGTWGGRNWSSNWRHHHHRFSNDVIFFNDFGFPGWWGYPYGYYGYDYYPYDYYGYYDDPGYGYRYGSRSRNMRRFRSR